jgi:RNA 2',3'-cyclic 3'-phosphodiesterase
MANPSHQLFFALRPPAATVAAIAEIAGKLKASGLLHGSWLKPAKYHVTLHFLGTHDHFPDDLRERAGAAASNIAARAQEIAFERIASFDREHDAPCVLRCTPRTESALREFVRELARALAAAGVPAIEERDYLPHLTIGYATPALPEPLPIEPLAWVAREFMLIDSHIGEGWHEELARWPLSA